jgi:hypothetical protein
VLRRWVEPFTRSVGRLSTCPKATVGTSTKSSRRTGVAVIDPESSGHLATAVAPSVQHFAIEKRVLGTNSLSAALRRFRQVSEGLLPCRCGVWQANVDPPDIQQLIPLRRSTA